jgi:hypothetical protein
MSRFSRLATCAVLLSTCSLAYSWKPKTHVYLASLAWDDVKDGSITIDRFDPVTGAVVGKLGPYPVRQDLRDAVQANFPKFVAGIIGPDGYPDLITGQSIIHPENVPYIQGTNAWLEHVWSKGMQGGPSVKAFTVGYMIHGAGDMYAHTYMNHYAGGDFEIGQNAIRHIVLEGMFGKKTPTTYADLPHSIDNSIRTFVYNNLIDGRPGTYLGDTLLQVGRDRDGNLNKLAHASIPLLYSRLRARLVNERAQLQQASGLEAAVNGPRVAYLNAWIEDIDDGLKEWVNVSDRLLKIFIYAEDETKSSLAVKSAITEELNTYVNNHLLSMSGAPDFVGKSRAQAQAFTDQLMEQMGLDDLKENIGKAILSLGDYIVQKTYDEDMTLSQFIEYWTRPEIYFDQVLPVGRLRSTSRNGMTLAQFNQNEFFAKADGNWDLAKMPAAYNTVLMTKLIFLSKDQINKIIADSKAPVPTKTTSTSPLSPIGTPQITQPTLPTGTIKPPTLNLPAVTLTEDNVMLGFNHKLDGDTQWRSNQSKMVFEKAGVYYRIFKKQTGETTSTSTPVAPPAPKTVTLTITSVKQAEGADIDFLGDADFYPVVQFDSDLELTKPYVLNDDAITPNWTFTKTTGADIVTIKIRIFDSDGGVAGNDDECDINPSTGRFLTITYNLRTGALSGGGSGSSGSIVTRTGSGEYSVEIKFKITHQ